MTMTLVSTVEVGAGGVASIDFGSIVGTATDLLLVMSLRDTSTATSGTIGIQFNADTGANYNGLRLRGDGSSVNSSTSSGDSYVAIQFANGGNSSYANTFSNGSVYIPNYAGSTVKSLSIDNVQETNSTTGYDELRAAKWSGTAAITSVKVTIVGRTIAQYSTASLYTITKGSGGATVS